MEIFIIHVVVREVDCRSFLSMRWDCEFVMARHFKGSLEEENDAEIRVCILGDFSKDRDEGLKNIAHHLSKNLGDIKEVRVMEADLNEAANPAFFFRIRAFRPDIIHYIPGPTNRSFVFLRVLKSILCKRTKIVLSAVYPIFDDTVLRLLRLRVDHVFCASKRLQRRFSRLGINTSILPNGVDINKFVPVRNEEEKRNLRLMHGLEPERFTALHVGHLLNNRNLGIMEGISSVDQGIVLASSYIGVEDKVLGRLMKSGCKVIVGYSPEVEQFYQLSDCYVFPVLRGNTIAFPLSVLEAMACNLPVITSRCEGITTFFQEEGGLYFADTEDEISKA